MSSSNSKLFPSDTPTKELASKLYELIADLPIISPHGHVDPELLAKNKPFGNPTELFILKDHYVTRLLHANGVELSDIYKNPEPRKVWHLFYKNYHVFNGTSSGYWFEDTLENIFGISEVPSIENADRHYDLIASNLLEPAFLPKALAKQFNIEILATTDDPIDDLAFHRELAADTSFETKVVPTFRPDKYLDPRIPGWNENVSKLLNAAGETTNSYENYIKALENRRNFFKQHGAFSSDHGVFEPYTCILKAHDASIIYENAIKNTATEAQLRDFAGHMLAEMARMATVDGLVMTIHAGVIRNHHQGTLKEFGPDTGHDLPVTCEWVQNLKPLLNAYGTHKNLKIVLFSLDETNWSREIAPLASFYPSVFIGAPWWFLDAPEAIQRFRSATVDIAGFYKGSGFIDDTRAFLSIPARHDLARRSDSAYLAKMITEGRITLEQSLKISVDLVTTIPRKAFNL
jgi:glucuronate isomerase